jgi:oligopeptidase A
LDKALPNNPLLDFAGLPRYADVRHQHVTPAIDLLLAEARAAVARAEQAPPDWDEFVAPLDDATERLGRAWGQVSHLHAVLDSPELRAAYNENLPKLTQFWTELGHNEALFAVYRALRASPAFATLTPARQRIVENALRDFRLGGAELAADRNPHNAKIQDELARLGA